ncbi:glycosyltransferase family 2 protein [Fluviicola taffensis]|uniref:Glycosyl transferase family 2 n=1 Tax=Fluviicola taffensis (strain DSM 16823 / NCIMB 13979 / RW262) TaxID=755732 RepID=F2IJR9_FLUTR|nr:glycosyltransferase family 2 protein [Fluviicola taffensis]AEA43959.1 glycosyl transferase family 2 [Fluviicola taffensis DSM 16823]
MFNEINKLSIIVPAYNEEKTILEVITLLEKIKLVNDIEKEIIIIDDHSKDKTAQLVSDYIAKNTDSPLIFFSQVMNQGKGAAIHKGIELASGNIIVIQDADLELVPEEINSLLSLYLKSPNQIVYGSRFLEDKHSKTNFIWHIMGNGFLTKLSNLFSGYRLTDMMTCYKMIPAATLKSLKLKEKRFGFEPEVTMKLSKIKSLKIHEVPITYIARNKEEGKKISWKDGMKVIWCVVRYRFGN